MKNIYAWNIQDKVEVKLVREFAIHESILKNGESIQQSMEGGWYQLWSKNEDNYKGTAYFEQLKKNTDEWCQNPSPIKCMSLNEKDHIESLDFLPVINWTPTVSQRVYEQMLQICPNDFEAFDLIIDTPTGVSTNFKLINILSHEYELIDLDSSKYGGAFYVREPNERRRKRVPVDKASLLDYYKKVEKCEVSARNRQSILIFKLVLKEQGILTRDIARLGECGMLCMFSERLIDSFKSLGAKGFNYQSIECYVDQLKRGE